MKAMDRTSLIDVGYWHRPRIEVLVSIGRASIQIIEIPTCAVAILGYVARWPLAIEHLDPPLTTYNGGAGQPYPFKYQFT